MGNDSMNYARRHVKSTLRLSLVGFAALFDAACGSQPGHAPAECISTTIQPIYTGTTEPYPTSLPSNQARAVGAIEDEDGTLFCSGVIISAKAVLSAAHCAAAGGLYLRVAALDATAPRLRLGKSHVSPASDLALVELLGGDELDESVVRPPALMSAQTSVEVRPADMVVLAGVGVTDDGARGQVRFVEEPVAGIDQTSISVDGRGRTGACLGDSGGPLMRRTVDGAAEIVGILSKGAASCRGIDVYTRVDTNLAWIRQTEALIVPAARTPCAPE